MKARLFGLFFLASLVMACGANGPKYTGPTAGPTAILNGSSTSAATSYWTSANCFLKVELGADGSFVSDVNVDGTWTMTPGTWTASGTNNAAASAEIDGLTNIQGSTFSQSFSASQVSVYYGYQQELGPLRFCAAIRRANVLNPPSFSGPCGEAPSRAGLIWLRGSFSGFEASARGNLRISSSSAQSQIPCWALEVPDFHILEG